MRLPKDPPNSFCNVHRLEFTDKLYALYFFLASVGLLLRPSRVADWPSWLLVNLVCALVIGFLARNHDRGRQWNFLYDWYALLMFIVCFEETSHLSFLVRAEWQDRYLLRLEAWLFSVPPTVWMGHLGSPIVTELMELGYFSYFVLFIIVGGVLYRRGENAAFRHLRDATVLSYLICYVVFVFFPTEGPAYTLVSVHDFPLPGGGPFHWLVTLIQKHGGVHGNAFPSAHVAGGVVAVIFACHYAPRLGAVLTPLFILLCLGAVYDRYHYFSDVLVGGIIGAVPATSLLLSRPCSH